MINNNPDKVSVADLLKPKHKIVAYNNQVEVSVADLLKHKRVANETFLANLLKHKRVANETSLANLLKKVDPHTQKAHAEDKRLWSSSKAQKKQQQIVATKHPKIFETHFITKKQSQSILLNKNAVAYINNNNDNAMPYDNSGSYDDSGSYNISVPYDDSTGIPDDDSVPYENSVPYEDSVPYDDTEPNISSDSIKDLLIFRPRTTYF
ncbi:hypothetical protein F8M41_003945 [Gigaspora margarita]|uniref:Uncharacterized protein n=1 Tax=Gigaspora margarita TaxID=4874 RepID=A0A8H3XCF9_GIGMA|nr:hypothetical protein F8M41_003945 [Gigaspora margarita]